GMKRKCGSPIDTTIPVAGSVATAVAVASAAAGALLVGDVVALACGSRVGTPALEEHASVATRRAMASLIKRKVDGRLRLKLAGVALRDYGRAATCRLRVLRVRRQLHRRGRAPGARSDSSSAS